ncbi:MAG: electron transfer flavoprotein beta subunit/FixA family protein [Bacteroidota bacterium]|nr:electron transfer flavoprotein beta subunit/FixA family protein [Bacteroidota bacterium]
MKFLVCISKTPDTTSKIVFDMEGKRLLEEGLTFIMNPYDEWYALVRAIELREKVGGHVDVVHVGSSSADMIIRKALAVGADGAYRIDIEPEASDVVAYQIAEFAKAKSYDIIFLGKETIDHNGSETGSILAEMLQLPFISYCNKLELEGTLAKAYREIEGGIEELEVSTPFVLSAAKGLAEQRIPNMKGIMDAKRKPLEVIPAKSIQSKVRLEKFELPEAKSSVKMISPDNIDALIDILHSEVKVI